MSTSRAGGFDDIFFPEFHDQNKFAGLRVCIQMFIANCTNSTMNKGGCPYKSITQLCPEMCV